MLSLLHAQMIQAQLAGSPFHRNYYTAHVVTMDDQKIHGVITSFSAEKIILTVNNHQGISSQRELTPEQIASMRYKWKKTTGRCLIYGALSGAVFGFFLGFTKGSDPNPGTVHPPDSNGWGWTEETAFQKGMDKVPLTALAGGLLGAITGSLLHYEVVIQGRRDRYEEARSAFKKLPHAKTF